MDINSGIYLGHTSKQPLIPGSSELVDGLEPHGQFTPHVQLGVVTGSAGWWGGGVPGVGWPGGYWEGSIPGNQPGPHLRLI